ncbi:DUF7537 family lipoprotein [Halorientalis salina]|uniref:DUF7537 family lipoprotein n=1 Tax=Halorientalis salina TaxID=2932266 RepID=UPI0010AB7EC7|nr:hypothetical protein [Halorientalis salina]
MDRGLLLAVAVVATVALAGCSWVAQEEPTQTPETNDSDIMVPSFRLDDHRNTLANTSYAVTVQVDADTDGMDRNETIRVRSDPETERFRRTNETSQRTVDIYFTASTLYSKIQDNETTYRNQSLDGLNRSFDQYHENRMQLRWLTEIYSFANFDRERNLTVDGREVTEFRLNETVVGASDTAQLTDANGSVYIDRDGVIRRAVIDVAGEGENGPFDVYIKYEVTGTGDVTVEPPTWLSEAQNATAANTTDTNASAGS